MRKAYKELISDLYYQIALLKNPPRFMDGDKVEILYCQLGLENDKIGRKKGIIRGLKNIDTRPVPFTHLGVMNYVANPVYFVECEGNISEIQQWRLR
jgi:hypothetical protein